MLFDDINFNIFVLFWVSPKCLHFFRDPFFFFFGRGLLASFFMLKLYFQALMILSCLFICMSGALDGKLIARDL